MRRVLRFAVLLGVVGALGGCGGDGATGPSSDDITGVWRAAKVEYVSRDSGASIDLIALGGTGTLALDPGGRYAFSVVVPGEGALSSTGTWRLDGDVLTTREDGVPWEMQFDVDLAGATLRLGGADVEFDVDRDGRDEDAELNLELVR